MQGQNQNTRLRIGFQDLPRRLKAIQVRHSDVEDDDIRLQLLRLLDCLAPFASFSANLPLRLCLQQGNQPLAHDLVIISHQNPEDSHLSPPPGPFWESLLGALSYRVITQEVTACTVTSKHKFLNTNRLRLKTIAP